MKKLIALGLLLVLCLPPLLSVVASYYIKNHLTDALSNQHFTGDINIEHLEFTHGWFKSNAQIDFNLGANPSKLTTVNIIHHGPLIWPRLIRTPLDALNLYQVDSQFEFLNDSIFIEESLNKGTATILISYSGKSNPQIQHPGLTLRLAGSNVYADLPQIESEFISGGLMQANFSANQLDLQDRFSGLYANHPNIDIKLAPGKNFPQQLVASTSMLNASVGSDVFTATDFKLNTHLETIDDHYQFSGQARAQQFGINQALVNQTEISLGISEIGEDLIDYIYVNKAELTDAISNNHWLVLLKHFSQIIKQLDNQPQIDLKATGQYSNLPLHIEFQGKLVSDDASQLNPFSLLENLDMNLVADIPVGLMEEMNRPEWSDFLSAMSAKGLLIRKDQSYHSKLTFQDAKLRATHHNP